MKNIAQTTVYKIYFSRMMSGLTNMHGISIMFTDKSRKVRIPFDIYIYNSLFLASKVSEKKQSEFKFEANLLSLHKNASSFLLFHFNII